MVWPTNTYFKPWRDFLKKRGGFYLELLVKKLYLIQIDPLDLNATASKLQ